MWLNMIKQKGLKQMASVNFHWHFLKENRHGKAIVPDFILEELIGH